MNKTWDLKSTLLKKIYKLGGFVNSHAHFDRAYTISLNNLQAGQLLMEEKWKLVDEMKKKSSEEDFYKRIKRSLDWMIKQKVKACASFIDIDPIVEFRALHAALKLQKEYKSKIKFLIINQVLKGVLTKQSRYYIEKSLPDINIIGGLPSKDRPHADKHIDYILSLVKSTGKIAHVHIDQENNPHEKDTELLARKTIQHRVEGKVVAVHAISFSAQTLSYRKKIYPVMKAAGFSVIICPSAAVNMKDLPFKSYLHKPIAPVEELIEQNITVALGVDNMLDIYEPFLDGDLWFETRLLIEVCRYYNLDNIAKIATINGKKVLGIQN